MSPVRIGLSTTSVFPEPTSSGFELAASLGYDGVEVMVSGLDDVSVDPDAMADLRDYHNIPVLSIHAPTLLATQFTWGRDPWAKLERSAQAAHTTGADVVVVHPPFRWQRGYARAFVDGVRRLNQESGVTFCVENMYPWRTPGGELMAYAPGWDPLLFDYEHLTLDLSHASTARQRSLELVEMWGDRLRHIHLTDGTGGTADDHLLPGEGDQQADLVLQRLAERGFDGHVVLEVSTRKAGSRAEREEMLGRALEFTRRHLGLASA